MRKQAPEYAAIQYPQPLKLSQIALAPGEVLIEYAVTDKETVAWLIRKKKIVKKIRIKKERKDLEILVDDYCDMLSNSKKLVMPAFDPQLGFELYQLLLNEFIPFIDEKEHVIIVPDKKLALLPFETLIVSYPKNWTTKAYPIGKTLYYYTVPDVIYFGDKYSLSYYQSASALTQVRNLKKAISDGEKFFILADPIFNENEKIKPKDNKISDLYRSLERQMGIEIERLPLTFNLAQELEKIFGSDNTDLMIWDDAKEAALKRKDLTNYRYLVMATHGILDGHISGIMEPALVLSQIGKSEEEDGFLTMSEVMELKLSAEIAALTACQTGNGESLSGEGVMGLGRAFQFAGASSVLVSLWSVSEESTVKLAERFFYHIKQGKNCMSALQLARRDIRKDGYDHPFFWAPFVLHGEWR